MRERLRRQLEREVSSVRTTEGARLRVALAYPNTYRVGMSNLGMHTLFRMLNEMPDVSCERVFLPDPEVSDAEARPLLSLDGQRPVADFDVLAISASFENDYPNVLRLLDLAGLPLRASERDERHPLVLMGGATVSINPEPLAPFLDLCCLGEGEELVGPLVEALLRDCPRRERLIGMAGQPGFYVPSLYRSRYTAVDDGAPRFSGLQPEPPAPESVTKVRASLRGVDRVAATAVFSPDTEFGDRITLEVARGCTKGCRYCWVGYSILPFRVHRVEDILQVAERWRPVTERVGLVATALLDHPDIEAIAAGLRARGFQVFAPSLIISTLRETLLRTVVESGQETLTIAPEAGSERMRQLIMKKITNEEILDKVRMIFRAGILHLRNYVIIGLPGEQQEDLDAIVELAERQREIMIEEGRERGRIGTITLSINCLIPKPGTPFQWAAQLEAREYRRRLRYLHRKVARVPNVQITAMSHRDAEIQAVLSRGDRRVADLLERWHEGGNFKRALREWTRAGNPEIGEFLRERDPLEPVPWGHLRIGPSDPALLNQWKQARTIAADTGGEALQPVGDAP